MAATSADEPAARSQAKPPPAPASAAAFLGDAPYVGVVRMRVEPPAHSGMEPDAGQGRGTARYLRLDNGQSKLEVSGEASGSGTFWFDIDGDFDGQGRWVGDDGDLAIAIDPMGNLSGKGRDPDVAIDLRGAVSKSGLKLRTELVQATDAKGLPAGTRLVFEYDLKREAIAPSGSVGSRVADDGRGSRASERRDASDDGSGQPGTCKKVEWKLRNVANLSGGPMHMVRVPVCVQH